MSEKSEQVRKYINLHCQLCSLLCIGQCKEESEERKHEIYQKMIAIFEGLSDEDKKVAKDATFDDRSETD